MKCFICGNDADMEMYINIQGQNVNLSICNKCFHEQNKKMMEMFNSEDMKSTFMDMLNTNGDKDFESIFKENILKNNGQNTEFMNNFMQNLDENMKEFIKNINSNLNKDEFNKNNDKESKVFGFNPYQGAYMNPDFSKEKHNETQVEKLKRLVRLKREKLYKQVNEENYLAAANYRDEIRELNKRIMVIKKLSKEGDSK